MSHAAVSARTAAMAFNRLVDRDLDGRTGLWVVTPVAVCAGPRTSCDPATDPAMLVVRGWTPTEAAVPSPPTGTVEPITIVNISNQLDGDWLVEVEATPGSAYTLLGSSDLAEWVAVESLNATANRFTFEAPREVPHNFFRVQRGL